MNHKRTAWQAKGITVTVLLAALVWLAACSAPATTTPADASPAETAPTTAAASESATTTEEPTEASTEAATDEETTAAEAAIVKLNLNSATADEFMTVPNVGNRMVREFNEYRPYTSILQFRREIGKYVDDDQVAAYEEYLYVPVVPNEADADTLQQLPGVTPDIADELIAGRPYASNEAFVEALASHVTADELAIGTTYLETE